VRGDRRRFFDVRFRRPALAARVGAFAERRFARARAAVAALEAARQS